MNRSRIFLSIPLVILFAVGSLRAGDGLRRNFLSPPNSAKPWCYWWWLKGMASPAGITRDFEEMKKQGIAGALLFDAGEGGPEVPQGAAFMSRPWRELFKHALHEADRCGIVLSVNLCSGWNAGGPWVTPEHAAKKLAASTTVVQGAGRATVVLPKPETVQGFYRDIVVLASPLAEALPGCKLVASSQYQGYAPALAEDGSDANALDFQRGQVRHGADAGEAGISAI